jgi:hypothetical protein
MRYRYRVTMLLPEKPIAASMAIDQFVSDGPTTAR